MWFAFLLSLYIQYLSYIIIINTRRAWFFSFVTSTNYVPLFYRLYISLPFVDSSYSSSYFLPVSPHATFYSSPTRNYFYSGNFLGLSLCLTEVIEEKKIWKKVTSSFTDIWIWIIPKFYTMGKSFSSSSKEWELNKTKKWHIEFVKKLQDRRRTEGHISIYILKTLLDRKDEKSRGKKCMLLIV
jgi:hypothetical protein